VLAGVFVGLSAGTKYTGAVGIIGVLAAILYAKRPDSARLYLSAIVGALLAFVISTAGVLLDRERFMAGFSYEL